MAVLSSLDILLAYLPVYGESRGLTVGTVTMLLTVRAGASLASRTLMVPLIRTLGRRRLLGFGTLLPAIALGILPITGSVALLVTLMGVAGFGLGYGQPVSLAWIASQVPVEIRGTAVAIRLTGNRLGQLAVPAVAGALAGATGIAAVFVAIGLALGASALTVLRSPFDDQPGTASALDG
jgi:MFS family permease